MDTHYYYRPRSLEPVRFARFAADVRKLLDTLPPGLVIRGPEGSGPPEVSEIRIAFNGDRSTGSHHEALVIEQEFRPRHGRRTGEDLDFEYCKTSAKPYDLLVVAVLYAFAYHFPDARFESDRKGQALMPGYRLFTEVCRPDLANRDLSNAPAPG